MKLKYILAITFVLIEFNILKLTANESGSLKSDCYRSMAINASWSYSSGSKALYFKGKHEKTYVGWIDNYGDVTVGTYDHVTSKVFTKVVFENNSTNNLENPSLTIDKDGKLIAFFTNYSNDVPSVKMIKAARAENIEDWQPVQTIYESPELKGSLATSLSPVQQESGEITLIWSEQGKRLKSIQSHDGGNSWINLTTLSETNGDIISYGAISKENQIHIAYSTQKSIYYKCIGDKNKSNHQFQPYCEATETYNIGAIYSLSINNNNEPVVVFAKQSEKNYGYYYGVLKKKINDEPIIDVLPQRYYLNVGEVKQPYDYELGGISVDPENSNVLYVSVVRDSIYEIEKWTTKNDGKSWEKEMITKSSVYSNIKPVAVYGAEEGNPLQLVWLLDAENLYVHSDWPAHGRYVFNYHAAVKMSIPIPAASDPLAGEDILRLMQRVADWQFVNFKEPQRITDWAYGAYFSGVTAYLNLVPDSRYKNELVNIGARAQWKPYADYYNPDRLMISDTYAWLFNQDKDSCMINYSRWAMDGIILSRPVENADLRHTKENKYRFEWLSWIDGLYMAPPSMVYMSNITGDDKYMNYATDIWWKVSDYLYSAEDSLWFRDDNYFNMRSENGKKIFWSRGNGWGVAALARMMNYLPNDHPMRPKFEEQYLTVMHKLLNLQREDGLWNISLLDPDYIDLGETSGSMFFTYALAWGINTGILDRKYTPQLEKAWVALCKRVDDGGMLGYVQQVAGDPYPFHKDEWHVYASGAFLLAGTEMYKLQTSK